MVFFSPVLAHGVTPEDAPRRMVQKYLVYHYDYSFGILFKSSLMEVV